MFGIVILLRCLLLDPCIWFSIEKHTTRAIRHSAGGIWKTEWG